MEQNEKYFHDLTEVRKLMEKSSRFISLSGWSGIMAGVYALGGLFLARKYINNYMLTTYQDNYAIQDIRYQGDLMSLWSDHSYLFLLALAVVTLSVLTGIILTVTRAKQKGQNILDKIGIRMIVNLSIPVVTGGAFILLLLQNGYFNLLIPAMLIFYGLGLVNGSKYTLSTIRNLGIVQIALGIIAGIFPEYDFHLWAIGFGFMHILYGALMWWNYEYKSRA